MGSAAHYRVWKLTLVMGLLSVGVAGADIVKDVRCSLIGPDPTEPCAGWRAQYDSVDHRQDVSWSVAPSPDGSRIYLVGDSWSSESGVPARSAVAAFDATTGDRQWLSETTGVPGSWLSTIAANPANNLVYAGGLQRPASGGQTAFVLAYDGLTGVESWRATPPGWQTTALVVSLDGSLLYALISAGSPSVLALDASTGATLWTWKSSNAEADRGSGLALHPSGGRLFVAAGAQTDWDSDYLTTAVDAATGAELWSARFDRFPGIEDGQLDVPRVIKASPKGDAVVVTGWSYRIDPLFTTSQYLTVAYDAATGAPRWSATSDGIAETATGLAIADDQAVVTGFPGLVPGGRALTIAYDLETGAEVWRTESGDATGLAGALDLAASKDGDVVYLTGVTSRTFIPIGVGLGDIHTPVGGAYDLMAAAIDARTGLEQWSVREPLAIGEVVLPLGDERIIVSGHKWRAGTDWDFLVLAYDVPKPLVDLG